MRNYIFFVLFALCLLLDSCFQDEGGTLAVITIKNNSGDTIWYYGLRKTNINDTLLPEVKPNFDIRIDGWGIKPYSSKKNNISVVSTVYTDLQKYMDDFVLIYYFFNYDSINTFPWSKIREKNIYMKRVIIDTKQDLENCNNVIAFP